jgi:hypothetical protein
MDKLEELGQFGGSQTRTDYSRVMNKHGDNGYFREDCSLTLIPVRTPGVEVDSRLAVIRGPVGRGIATGRVVVNRNGARVERPACSLLA